MPPIELDTLLERVQVAGREPVALADALAEQHPADIAEAMNRLDHDEALAVFNALDNARAAEVLDELEPELARYLLDHAVPGRIAELLDRLPMDDAAEVVAEFARTEPGRAEKLLSDLAARSPEDAAEVRELLSYRERTAGRLMTEKFVRLPETLTVEQAFAAVRHADPEVETLSDLYMVERDGPNERLLGVLSLRALVRSRPRQRLSEIMERDLVTVTVDTDQEEVARLIAKYDFMALPVLDREGFLAGIVTVDDIVDVLVEEQTEDIFKQSAIAAEPGVLNLPYFSVPIGRVVKSRVGWLVLLFVAETATGVVLRHFEDELARVVALSFFVPLLIGTGGNTGAQTVSTIIRGMALGEIRGRDTGKVLVRELTSGVLLGMVLGTIAFGRALLWKSGVELSLVVALTILAICTWANTIGALIPLLAQKLKIDPALVSAPLITTLVDATGLVIYLSIARLLLAALH